MEDEVTKFSVSYLALRVCGTGSRQVIDSWNVHVIPGKGTPNNLQAQNDRTTLINERVVQTRDEAVKLYEERGGQLTFWPEFGIDPLCNSEIMALRHSNEFNANFLNLNDLFYEVVKQ